jgi:hypothetical protein
MTGRARPRHHSCFFGGIANDLGEAGFDHGEAVLPSSRFLPSPENHRLRSFVLRHEQGPTRTKLPDLPDGLIVADDPNYDRGTFASISLFFKFEDRRPDIRVLRKEPGFHSRSPGDSRRCASFALSAAVVAA